MAFSLMPPMSRTAKMFSAVFETVDRDLGEPDIVVFNAGAYQKANVVDIDPADFERCWRIGCLEGLLVGQAAARRMVKRGRGTIIFTGATAALRGSAGFANLAVPKFGLRALSQSMARELGPQGVHVSFVIIDGQIEFRALPAPYRGAWRGLPARAGCDR